MKTASLVASLSRDAGGLFESVRRLHQSLAALPGVEVTVYGLRDEHTDEDLAAWSPVKVFDCPIVGLRQFGYSPVLRRRVMETEFDILHTHGIWMYPSVVSSAWGRRNRRPYMISSHGMLDPWAVKNSAWKKRIARLLYEDDHLQNASCIRALCNAEAQAIRQFGLNNPICVIPNGIDLPFSGNGETLKTENLKARNSETPAGGISACQHFSISDFAASGRKVLLYLGRIHPKKGLVNLLRAWAAAQMPDARHRTPEWALAIAGWDQGGHEAELKRLATELGIAWTDVRGQKSEGGGQRAEGRGQREACFSASAFQNVSVLFLGPQFNEAKAACYQNFDAFILPSFSEGLPMVVLEAWAYGKPILMTPECNLPEGFAANAAIRIETNVESIAHGLYELFRTPDSALHSLGGNGYKLVSDKFTWRRIATDMWEVYEWLLGQRTKPVCVVER